MPRHLFLTNLCARDRVLHAFVEPVTHELVHGNVICILTRQWTHHHMKQEITSSGSVLRVLPHAWPWQGIIACVCRSVLAMRQIAHKEGADVKPVIVVDKARGQGQGVFLQEAQPESSAVKQVQRALLEAETNPKNKLDPVSTSCAWDEHNKEPFCVVPENSSPHLIALPAECNLTGIQPSASTLHALCRGTAHWPEVCFVTMPCLQQALK
jgi:hypothetical protein